MLVQILMLTATLAFSPIKAEQAHCENSPISVWSPQRSATTINNNTGCTITYSVRWGNSPWQVFTLQSGQCFCHYWTADAYSQVVPRFEITFDTDFGNWNYYQTYSLISTSTYYTDCIYGSQYSFQVSNGNIDLFKD